MQKFTLEKVIGIALILFGCFFTSSIISDSLSNFHNELFIKDTANYEKIIIAMFYSNTLIIIAGVYLIKNKNN